MLKVKLLKEWKSSLLCEGKEERIAFLKPKFIQMYISKLKAAGRDGMLSYDEFSWDAKSVIDGWFDALVSSDPTPNGKYLNWLINCYKTMNGNQFKEDHERYAEYLAIFDANAKKMPQEYRDINKFKSPADLYKILKELGFLQQGVAKIDPNQIKSFLANGTIEKAAENDAWVIYIPHDEKASCFLGKGTEWCTAKYAPEDERNMFRNYSREDKPLFVCFNKKDGSKIQVHLDSNQVMNIEDEPIDMPKDLRELLIQAASKSEKPWAKKTKAELEIEKVMTEEAERIKKDHVPKILKYYGLEDAKLLWKEPGADYITLTYKLGEHENEEAGRETFEPELDEIEKRIVIRIAPFVDESSYTIRTWIRAQRFFKGRGWNANSPDFEDKPVYIKYEYPFGSKDMGNPKETNWGIWNVGENKQLIEHTKQSYLDDKEMIYKTKQPVGRARK